MEFTRSTFLMVLGMGIFLLLLGVVVWFVLQQQQAESLRESKAGTALTPTEATAPFTDLSGQERALDDYIGRVLVVYSWASWCVQCEADLNTLEQIALSLNTDELVVLAINRGEQNATAERYLNSTIGTDARVELILDPDDTFYSAIDGYAMPETVIFNRSGEELVRYRTPLSVEELSVTIAELLE